MVSVLAGLFFVGVGVFGICGAVLEWNWFMNHRKARALIRLFGRTGTRIFYVLLGVVVIVLGVLGAMGLLDEAG